MKAATLALILLSLAVTATAQAPVEPEPVPVEAEPAPVEAEPPPVEPELAPVEPELPPVEPALVITVESAPLPVESAPLPAEATEEPEKKGPYSNKIHGKLWLEALAGPTVYDPDLFTDYATFGVLPPGFASLNLPKQKGPEFGGAIGGAFLDGMLSIGGVYRQANYEAYKLMKAGVLFQAAFRTPFVHPVIRASFGYTKTFGGEVFPAAGLGIASLRNNGFFGTIGVGIRIPIVRWISVLASFEWTGVLLYLTGEDVTGSLEIFGHQYGGTFALTFHFVGVYDE